MYVWNLLFTTSQDFFACLTDNPALARSRHYHPIACFLDFARADLGPDERAVAQKTFLALRQLSTTHQLNGLTCIAISHSSAAATQKWLDLIGGAWSVQVIVDEDRAIYAAWGLGLSSVWYYFNPATQTAAWKEKGWLGARVATSIQRSGGAAAASSTARPTAGKGGAAAEADDGLGPASTMGNKWQQGGAFAVDERGTVVWGGKAKSADEMMDLDAGCKALGCT